MGHVGFTSSKKILEVCAAELSVGLVAQGAYRGAVRAGTHARKVTHPLPKPKMGNGI